MSFSGQISLGAPRRARFHRRHVKVPFSLFLALRYLKPKRTFVSIITLISVLGVTLGIAVLIIVIAVMTGFDRELQRTILGFEPHVVVGNGQLLADWRELTEKIKAVPGVVAVAPFAQGPVLAEHEGNVLTPMLRGIDIEQEQRIVDLKKFIVEGTADMAPDTVLIGRVLADQLGLHVGEKMTVYAPGNINGIMDELRREQDNPGGKSRTLAELKGDIILPRDLTIAGIFESGRNIYDANILIVPLFVAQELYTLGDSVHGLSIQTTSPDQAGPVADALRSVLGPTIEARTWWDNNHDRLDAVRLERSVMFIILMFLIVIAAFGIMNTLITVTVQKTREIGVMKALGARPAQIIYVFLFQGMVVGFLGNLTGLGLGMLTLHYRNPFKDWLSNRLGIEIFPATIYDFKGIPAEIVPHDVATICVCAFFICSLAALLPAWSAARLDPVKALRYE
jgi:lipoprotein-releasing system permease protein